jgi:penicillin-binding protein 1A
MAATETHNKNPNKLKRRIFIVIKSVIIILLVFIFASVGIFGGSLIGIIKTTTLITNEELQLENFTSIIYDSKGNVVTKLKGEENREWIDIKNIQPELQKAFIATEDIRFYEHSGVDYPGAIRAIVNRIKNPNAEAEGASTITMQLVKNLTTEDEKTLERKLKEQYRAMQLEKKLSKSKILELYLNTIYLSEGAYGVKAAALRYFNKDLSKDNKKNKLTLAECVCLSVITQVPAKYDPLTKEGLKNNTAKRKYILKIMLDNKMITQAEYDKAVNAKLKFVNGARGGSSQSYFVDAVINQVVDDCQKIGISKKIALDSIYNKGWKIYTTLDKNIQSSIDKVFTNSNNRRYFPTLNQTCYYTASYGTNYYGKKYDPQGAMVILDPKTGYVKGLYGGRGVKTVDLSSNYATDGSFRNGTFNRNNGSSFKPVAVYAPALETDIITPNTVINEITLHMDPANPGKPYPTNYNNGKPHGKTPVRTAIKYSYNITAAIIWDKLMKSGTGAPYNFLKKSGIPKPSEDRAYGVSVALGGTISANPLQMAGAYAVFANQGNYLEPILYTKVVKHDGTVLLDKTKGTVKQIKNKVYSPSTAYEMTDLLTSVIDSGTAAGTVVLHGAGGAKMPAAGKTGTTELEKDRWFVAYTPYYVGAVWFGDSKDVQMNTLSPSPADAIWNDVMNSIHKNLPVKQFKIPAGYKPRPSRTFRSEFHDQYVPLSPPSYLNQDQSPVPDQPSPTLDPTEQQESPEPDITIREQDNIQSDSED